MPLIDTQVASGISTHSFVIHLCFRCCCCCSSDTSCTLVTMELDPLYQVKQLFYQGEFPLNVASCAEEEADDHVQLLTKVCRIALPPCSRQDMQSRFLAYTLHHGGKFDRWMS